MRVAAVVPINALRLAKSRLAPVLSAAERERLVMWLLRRVTAVVGCSGAVAQLAVVSPDRNVLGWAEERGLAMIEQQGGDLNAAVELGRAWAHAAGAEALLVLLGDLPRLASEDVCALCDLAAELRNDGQASRGSLVLAPDRAGHGTNAMVLSPASHFPFSFGHGSYSRHVARAREKRMAIGLYISPRTGFDVDSPADLAELEALGFWKPESAADDDAPVRKRGMDGRAG